MEEIQVMEKRIGRLIAGAGVAALVAGFVGMAQSNVKAATATSSFAVTASVAANPGQSSLSDSTAPDRP